MAARDAVSAPAKPVLAPPTEAHAEEKSGGFLKWWLLAAGLLLVLIVAANGGKGESPEQFAARKDKCSRALMSSMGHSTTGYTDKQAYEAQVRDACDGLQINGQDLGKYGRP